MQMRILHILFFSIAFCALSAQKRPLVISTDFQNCGVGLKDSAGNWVLPPSYEEIRLTYANSFYLMIGNKEGIADANGKVVIPPIYDHIWKSDCPENSNVFNVTLGHSYGVLDSAGRIIVPVECSSINTGPDTTFSVIDKNKKYAIYRYDGSKTIVPFKNKYEILPLGEHIYIFSKKTFGPKNKYIFANTERILLGVMNDSGRVILPPIYDNIVFEPGKQHVITVYKNGKLGFFTVKGKQILPVIFKDPLESYFDYTYESCNKNYYSFINTNGYAVLTLNNKYGLVNAQGDSILPFIYDNIYQAYPSDFYLNTDPSKFNYIVTKDSLLGIFSPTQGWIFKPEFETVTDLTKYRSKTDSNFVDVLLAKKNGYWGVITTSQQAILPFEYDEVYSKNTNEIIFRKKNELFCLVFPMSYSSTFSNLRQLSGGNISVQSIPSSGLFSKKLFPDSTIVFYDSDKPFIIHSDFSYYSTLEVYNAQFLYDTLYTKAAMIILPVRLSRECENGNKFMAYGNVSVMHDSAFGGEELLLVTKEVDGKSEVYKAGETCHDSDFHYYSIGNDYSSVGIARSDGKIIIPPHFTTGILDLIQDNSGTIYFRVSIYPNRNSYGKFPHVGVYDRNGKLVVDTIWNNVSSINQNYAWVAIHKDHVFRKSKRDYYEWNVLNTNTNKLILSKGHESSLPGDFGNNVTAIYRLDGNRMVNLSTGNFITSPVFSDYLKLDVEGNWFLAKTCHGHMGVINADGNWLTDTTWTTMTPATYDASNRAIEESYRKQTFQTSSYFVLSNNTSRIIVDLKNKKTLTDSSSENRLLLLAENNVDKKLCKSCPVLLNDYHETILDSLENWQKEILFDSMFSPPITYSYLNTMDFCYTTSCKYCRKQGVYNYNEGWCAAAFSYFPIFTTDSVISVESFSSFLHLNYDYNFANHFFTVMIFNDGPREIFLDSLFVGTEWKNLIIDSVVNYLNSHLYIRGDCHNNASFPLLLNDSFLLTDKGLLLFPPGYSENSAQLVITIPWEKLKSYLRKDIASKIGIK
jgi:hypothetical protein